MKLKLMLFSLGMLFAFAVSAQSLDKLTGTKARGGDADPNIKQKEVVNTQAGATGVYQPQIKGGEVTRGGYCKVIFDNYTAWYVQCYVDGNYKGFIAPWGDGTVSVAAGTTSAYAVAEFDDGSRLTWGPISRDCNGDWTVQIKP